MQLMRSGKLHLTVMPGELVVCRLAPDAPAPVEAKTRAGLFSMTRTATELSIVCAAEVTPEGARCERGWRCLAVRGPLPFSVSGILASLAGQLAAAEIPIFALSTFDTDYVLVRDVHLERALAALEGAGHEIEKPVTGS